jgi:ankyrin repeat protein
MNSSNPICAQLSAAINAGDLVHLRTILLQKKGKRHIVTDHFLHYALYEATQKGSVESCRLLWERLSEDGKGKYFADKSINDAISGSLLHTAVIFGQLKVVRFFIEECNFNINQKDRIGRTPLFYARRSVELTGYLLEHGADVNLYKGTLTYAVETRRTEIGRLLLRHGAVPNRECFHRAIHRGNAEILSILLEHHPLAADLEHHKPDFGPTILNRF